MSLWDDPPTYAPAISHVPQHTPHVTTEPQAPLQQGSTAQHLGVRQYLDQSITSYQTKQRSILFVETTTNLAFPPDAQFLRDHLHSVASYHHSVSLSDKAINNALAAKRGCGDALPLDHPLYIRVVDDNGYITIQILDDLLVVIFPQLFRLYAFPGSVPGASLPHPMQMWRPPRPHIEPTRLNPIEYSTQNRPDVDQIFEATNLPYDQRILILAWLILCLMPNRQLVLLQITGEPQSGKSDVGTALLSLIDPQEMLIRAPTRRKDIEPELLSNYILALDAVNELGKDAQNLLVDCLVTYTYRGKGRPQFSFDIKRPVVVIAVESVVTDPELHKRTVSIELPSLHEKGHAPEFIDQTFPERMPGAFAGLLELTSKVLGALQDPPPLERTVSAEHRDYCRIGVLVADVLENDRSVFWEQYDHNQAIQQQKKIDAHTVARAIKCFGQDYPDGIKQPVHDWLTSLKPYSVETEQWPSSSHNMAARLKEAAHLLRPLGYEIVRNGKIGPYGYWTIKPPKSEE